MPFNDVVPPAFVSKVAALTVLNVVVPVLLAIIFANVTSFAKVKFPAPALAVKSNPVPVRVLLNIIPLPVKVLALLPVNVTPPVNC